MHYETNIKCPALSTYKRDRSQGYQTLKHVVLEINSIS